MVAREGTLALVVGVALSLLAGPAAGQIYHWSSADIRLEMANPSLAPQQDGAVHVGGDFIGQVFVTGNDSDRIAEMGFSFGKGTPSPQHTPVYTGAQDFRTDDTRTDGWILPITAGDTPPGDYKFAIHAYAEAGNPQSEIARMWGAAVLESSDVTPPWPWILPGETAQLSNPYGVQGVTIEFAENATAKLFVNGEQVNLTDWTPPERDDDSVPRQTIEQEKRVLGSGYKWTGQVQRGDVLRVEATDQQGTSVTKGVLAGFGADAPAVEIDVDTADLRVDPGEAAQVPIELANVGARNASVTAVAEVPEGWNGTEKNLRLAPGQSGSLSVTVQPPEGASDQRAEVPVRLRYPVGDQPLERTRSVTVLVGDIEAADVATNASAAGDDGGSNGTPLPAAVALLAGLAAAQLATRVRGDR